MSSRLFQVFAGLFLVCVGGYIARGDEAPQPLSPEDSLTAMVPRPGFKVELVAAEPEVMDPVAFAWGADGKLWVVEMADYPLGMDGQGKAGGRVKFLEDTDGDGRYERATLFLDGLSFPTGVMPWRKGVLVTAAPNILYAEDHDGDGKAEIVEPLYTGFAEGNPQHRMNGLRWGLDNWVHCAGSHSRGVIKSVRTGKTLEVGGLDFCIQPDKGAIDVETGATQFVRECDDWGHWFSNANSTPLLFVAVEDRYLRRNPHVSSPRPMVDVSIVPGAAQIFPVSRTLERFNEHASSNRFTSACSGIIYRDELLGPGFVGNSFVCEPVHNLVHREIVSPKGTVFTSHRADDEQSSEFLASKDNWFRPTMVRTGPDGAVWIADMYRAVIEHPEWIPQQTQKKINLRAGEDKGRIYRVYPENHPPRAIPRLDKLDTAGLVAALEHPSGTWRDMAQQLLVERADKSAKDALVKLVQTSARPQTRLQALATLDGLEALDDKLVLATLQDKHPGVRRYAVRLSEPWLNTRPEVGAAVARMVDDTDAFVRMQAAYSLGEWHDPRAGEALAKLLTSDGKDKFLTAAVLSSVNEQNLDTLVAATLPAANKKDGSPALFKDLAIIATATKNEAALARLLDAATTTGPEGCEPWQIAAISGFLEALTRAKTPLDAFQREGGKNVRAALARLDQVFETARRVVADEQADEAVRITQLELLGQDARHRSEELPVVASLFGPRTPPAVQSAAVMTLAKTDDRSAIETLVAGWKSYSPGLRNQVLDVMLRRGSDVGLLLDRVERGDVQRSEIDVTRLQRLLEHKDPVIRERAVKLLAAAIPADRKQVLEAFEPALKLTGDPQHGAVVFKKVCSNCHKVGDLGHTVGPDLTALGSRPPITLLTAILDPSSAIESRFLAYTAITDAGLTHVGLLENEASNSITLALPEGKRVTVFRSELELLTSNAKSLMPEGLEKEQTPQSMADLLAFLATLGPPRKQFPGNAPQVVRAEELWGAFYLLTSNAEIYGDTLELEPKFGNLGFWTSENDHAAWTFEVKEPGSYGISLEYSCPDASAGKRFLLSIDQRQLAGKISSTGSWETYRNMPMGDLELEPGQHRLVVRPVGKPAGGLMDLKCIRVKPIKTKK